jgi:hypothetical protein
MMYTCLSNLEGEFEECFPECGAAAAGKKRKALNVVTMYKRTGDLNETKFKNIVGNKNKTDISKLKIAVGSGSHPSNKPNANVQPAVANPAIPHNDTLLLHEGKIKSREFTKKFGGTLLPNDQAYTPKTHLRIQ